MCFRALPIKPLSCTLNNFFPAVSNPCSLAPRPSSASARWPESLSSLSTIHMIDFSELPSQLLKQHVPWRRRKRGQNPISVRLWRWSSVLSSWNTQFQMMTNDQNNWRDFAVSFEAWFIFADAEFDCELALIQRASEIAVSLPTDPSTLQPAYKLYTILSGLRHRPSRVHRRSSKRSLNGD